MSSLVDRFLAWLLQASPETFSSLSPAGGTLAPLAPGMDTAIALYAAHDGQSVDDGLCPGVYEAYRWMTLDEVTSTREDLDGMAKVGEWDDQTWQRIDWWVPGWIPLLTDDNSNYLCIDTVGAFTGRVGQMIEFIHDDATRTVIASSFDAWFAAWVESLEAGTWRRDEEQQLERTKATDRLFAERMPGYPIEHAARKVRKPKPDKPKTKSRGKKPKPEEIALLDVFKQRMSRDEITAAIAAGAKLDARDVQGQTPLHLAMDCSSELPAQALIAAGADVNATDLRGWTPAHKAMFAHAKVVPQLVATLAGAQADLSRPDAHGVPPVFLAKTVEALDAMVAHGVDVTQPGPNGERLSAFLARVGAHASVVEAAKRHGG